MMRILTGNEAIAQAVKLSKVKVSAIYPITPQTGIIEELARLKSEGEIDAEIIRVESEHSAMAATLGAALAGVRVFTATGSQGLFYMHEMVWWTAGTRIPVVMVVGSRALGPPWNLWNEHTDFMNERDSGWLMAYASTPQEAFDLVVQAFRISEDDRVFLPMMVGMDGFILSHSKTNVYLPTQEEVDSFLPPRRQPYIIDPQEAVGMGNIFPPLEYMKLRQSIDSSIKSSVEVIKEVGIEYNKKVSPIINYSTLNTTYRLEDADYAVVLMGAWAGDAMEAIDELRRKGINIGLLRIRYVRPWADDEVISALKDKKAVLVVDRAASLGRAGPLYMEVASTTHLDQMENVITGIGGVSIGKEEFIKMFSEFVEEAKRGKANGVKWFYPQEVEKVELRVPKDLE
ncbi:MAG: pyruvate ferredoxin oxidoreductase [Sulfolobaceae archaeon]|nr:pyruvate ferredoxin oxidoreductase [Sulfolobaceae archaeon]